MSDSDPKPFDPYDPEVLARANRAILVGLQRQGETAEEAQYLLDELHELVGNLGVEIRGSLIAKIREESPATSSAPARWRRSPPSLAPRNAAW